MAQRKRLTSKGRLATVGAGMTVLLSTAAMAGTATMVLSVFSRPSTGPSLNPVTIPSVIAAAGSLFSMSGSAIAPVTIPATTASTPTNGTNTPATTKRAHFGINLTTPKYWNNERAFMNLAAGSNWLLISTSGQWDDMPADRLNANLEIPSLNPGEKAVRVLSVPNAAYLGQSVDIECSWQGKATVVIDANVARNIFISNNSAQFTWVPRGFDTQNVYFSNFDKDDPLRNFDCREAKTSRSTVFHPDFVKSLKPYTTVRFMDWQNTNANKTVRWATRTTPNSGQLMGNDGVAVEHLVSLANQAQVDPWFTVPWNADDDYIRKFAQYVKANLDPKRRAYVELSNEVWNYGFYVAHQAKNEGVAANLDDNPNIAGGKRYSQKTRQAMAIWTDVFADQPNRIVRVISCQNANWDCGRVVLSYGDTANYVDALAVAPYFHGDFASDNVSAANWNSVFTSLIPERISWVRDRYMENLRLAKQFNKRLIAYEAGQHLVGDDVELLRKIQRDPRMGAAYTQYMTNWDKDVGDLMVLFADVGVMSKYGAWGMQEYVGQPASQAPKYRAVLDYIAALPKT